MTDTTQSGQSGRCFYVSSGGDDRWSGTVPATSGISGRSADGPFATLVRGIVLGGVSLPVGNPLAS